MRTWSLLGLLVVALAACDHASEEQDLGEDPDRDLSVRTEEDLSRADDPDAGPSLPFVLTDEQRRKYLRYYAPILLKSADEGSSDNWGFDWLTNFDFDRDGAFANNKLNWEKVDSYVANPAAAEFAAWKIRPTMYTGLIEFKEGSDKSIILLFHVYHGKEEGSVHDWERIEIRVDHVNGMPGSGSEQVKYVVVTEHSVHNVRLYGSVDLNFMQTPSGKHAIIWQAEWSKAVTGFQRAELHFVENPWATLDMWNKTSAAAEVDVNGTSDKKDVHYVFVPEGDSEAAIYWGATALTAANASAKAAKATGTYSNWSQVKRITYELQDLADILPTHVDCSACTGGEPCTLEPGLQGVMSHWIAPTIKISLDEALRAEDGTTLVPDTTTCGGPLVFYTQSQDVEDPTDGAEGYPLKHWFWGAYRMGGGSETSYVFSGGAFTHPGTTLADVRPCPGGINAFFCEHDYYAHEGEIGSTSGATKYEFGRWLPLGWNTPAELGFDGRWVQLFPDTP